MNRRNLLILSILAKFLFSSSFVIAPLVNEHENIDKDENVIETIPIGSPAHEAPPLPPEGPIWDGRNISMRDLARYWMPRNIR